MTKKILFAVIGALVVVVAAGAAYMIMNNPAQMASMIAEPNNAVPAGPVTAISATSISITKQDGSVATFAITPMTSVVLAQDGQAGAPVTADAIKTNTIVLITPSESDPSEAQIIVIVPQSPLQ